MKIIYTYLLSLPIIFAFDMFWLGVFAKNFYAKLMSQVVTIQFYWPAVIAFYLLYIVGIFIFAVYPGVTEQSLQKTLIHAALFGFFCYMTYDLTNLATVKDWPKMLVFVDIAWGVILSTFTAYVSYVIYFWLK
jgi:uncharacterized membrane protein